MRPCGCIAFVLVSAFLPSTGSAETFTITSGRMVLFEPGPGPTVAGRFGGRDVEVDFERWAIYHMVPCVAGPCRPGDLVQFDTRLEIPFVQTAPVRNDAVGSATISGVTYPHVAFAGKLRFDGPDILLPVIPPDGGSGAISLSAPFWFGGSFAGYRYLDVRDPALQFALNPVGRGTATARLLAGPEMEYTLSQIQFDFEPIPEPGSVLLLGSGLLTLVAYRRRRRAQ